jgi:alpha 1,2-mannosyltransferase
VLYVCFYMVDSLCLWSADSIIHIKRYDWWAAPLFANPFYQYIFQNISSAQGFPILFKFLFQPKHASSDETGQCDWMIQYRTVWERVTAPLNQFEQCAVAHGMSVDDKAFLVTDSGSAIPTHTNIEKLKKGCRTGLECDRDMINTMHSMSKCKHAVLTHTSTFGACIAGLGQIQDTYYVKPDGSCHKKDTVDPMDAGVLDTQQKEVTNSLLGDTSAKVKGAFVFIMIHPSDESVRNMQRALLLLHQHFNKDHHYPIVLFVDDPSPWQYIQALTSARVHLVPVSDAEWQVPNSTDYPETFKLQSVPAHAGFNLNYRLMSRFAAGAMLAHELIARFEYVIKIDSDTFARADWEGDPFVNMATKKAKFGFWISYSDMDDVTVKLWETFVQYVVQNKLKLKQPGLLLSDQGKYRNTNMYGCFIGAKTSLFRSVEYQQLFHHFDDAGGILKYRWDEQKIYAMFIALYMEPTEVEFFDYVHIEHQGWAQNANRMDVQSPNAAVLQSIFGI